MILCGPRVFMSFALLVVIVGMHMHSANALLISIQQEGTTRRMRINGASAPNEELMRQRQQRPTTSLYRTAAISSVPGSISDEQHEGMLSIVASDDPADKSLSGQMNDETDTTNTNNNISLSSSSVAAAATYTTTIGTVNQRLLAELETAQALERNGPRSVLTSSKLAVTATTIFGSQRKTDAERELAIREARDLNGVNPFTALMGSVVALFIAFLFWNTTEFLAEYFALHPNDNPEQLYVLSRISAMVRNVAIGLLALASGFFGVTGIGLLLLGLRVAYGVVTGELDPTPPPKPKDETLLSGNGYSNQVELQEMWKFMTNQSKKRGQR